MGLKYRKRIRIAAGIHMNLSRCGFSVTAGNRFIKLNLGKRGLQLTGSAPGTGLSYQIPLTWKALRRWIEHVRQAQLEPTTSSPIRFAADVLDDSSGVRVLSHARPGKTRKKRASKGER